MAYRRPLCGGDSGPLGQSTALPGPVRIAAVKIDRRIPGGVDNSFVSYYYNIDACAFKNKAGNIPKNKISRYDIYQDTARNGKLWVGSKDGKIWKETVYYFRELSSIWKK